jgi:dienelactone hydrolase
MRLDVTTFLRGATLAAFGLLVAVGLVACGGSGGTTEGSFPASSSPPASTAVSPSPSSTIPSWQDLQGQNAGSTSTLVVDIPAADAAFPRLRKMYAYDRGEPLAFRELGAATYGARSQFIEYASAGCTVTGSLSVPAGEGPFPVVVMAAPGTMDFIYEYQIRALTRAGLAVLAIDAPNVRDPYLDMEDIEADPERYIEANARYVVDIRRALDLIETLPQLDSERIGYVGFSWTGMLGALLAGVDPRVKAYVLDYAGGSNRGLEGLTGEVQDPADYLAHSRGAAFLFQYTKEDTDDGVFSPARVEKLIEAAPEPKTFQWVKGGHGALFESADSPGSRSYRAWLERNL